MSPVKQIKFECTQWRHNAREEPFCGEIYFSQDDNNVEGAIELTIQAENLPAPIAKLIPVRVKVQKLSCHEKALKLIDWLKIENSAL